MYEDEEVGGKVKLKSIIGNNRKQLATFTTSAHFFPSLFLAGFTHLVDIHPYYHMERQKTIFFVPLSTIRVLAKTAKLPKSANLLHKTAKSAKSLKSAALTAGET